MKKKLGLLSITLLMIFALAACGNQEKNTADEGQQQDTSPVEEKVQDDDKVEGEEVVAERAEFETPETKPADLDEFDTVEVTIYYPNADADDFEKATEEINTLDIAQIIGKLAEYEVLGADYGFNSFAVSDDGTSLDLDMTAAFADYLRSQGSTGEFMVMGSLVNTLLENFGAEQIKITVDGEVLESGHTDYPDYMSYYKAAE